MILYYNFMIFFLALKDVANLSVYSNPTCPIQQIRAQRSGNSLGLIHFRLLTSKIARRVPTAPTRVSTNMRWGEHGSYFTYTISILPLVHRLAGDPRL
jgi:hypothetical protein